MNLKQIGEFGLIERLQRLLPPPDEALRVGIGDDAAVWRPRPQMDLVLTCDMLVEGRHFLTLSDRPPEYAYLIGQRAANVNLSDIAAMAALPRFALISLALPHTIEVETIEQIYRGLSHSFAQTSTTIAGGNITAIDGPFAIDITLGGEVESNKAILRSGSKIGDWIGMTGYPGLAAAGLYSLQHQAAPDFTALEQPIRAYLLPQARINEARLLAPHIHAMTDISDGLLLDLHNLLSPHQLGAILDTDHLPIHPCIHAQAIARNLSTTDLIFSPSDDYELLFTAPAQAVADIDAIFAKHNLSPLHWLGIVTDETHALMLRDHNRCIRQIEPTGWRHF
jgi:thiamine-monophosphate kinase